MSKVFVDYSSLSDAAARVAQIGPSVSDFQRSAAKHGRAAVGTRAAHGMRDLSEHWGAVLPHFVGATGNLSDVLRSAAEEFRVADERIGDAAAGVSGAVGGVV